MSVRRLAEMTWTEARDFAPRAVGIWPIGALEAHGPHLPLSTDVVISEEMARRAAESLASAGREVLLLPALAFTPAGYASAFAGTVSLSGATMGALLSEVAESLARWGMKTLVFANSHVDPANVQALREAVGAIGRTSVLRVLFPDKCQKPWVLRLPEEFRRGGAHAGYYETSLVMAARPELVREGIRQRLPRVDVDLGKRIRDGARTFGECGGPEAYFGNPAAATIEDGNGFYRVLAEMIVEAVGS